ncbi:MAG TPA: PQQ-binding-like beta-propeller repeat protein, partial [Planctomycetaceae bacterium]|nr:PQQ-binding-like beta-propeller repeat protein [Planctomycetaceae bacterium]
MVSLGFAAVVLSAAVSAAEWPQFRGPQGDGHADVSSLPTTWNETEHVKWKAALPGRGWSSPVIGNGLIWVTTAIEHPAGEIAKAKAQLKLIGNPMAKEMSFVGSITLRAVAVDVVTGAIKHDVELFHVKDPAPVHSLNSYASPSPILVDHRLLCHFGDYGTACVNTADGKILWKARLNVDHSVGPGSSPIIYEDLLIVPCDGADQQFVAALNIDDGAEAWKTPRPKMTGFVGDLHKAFSTPTLATINGQPQAIVVGAQWVVGYEPRTGKELWRMRHGEGFSNVPRPLIGNGFIYICTGFMKPALLAIRDDVQGEVTLDKVAWSVTKQVPAMPSPILVGKEVYFVSDAGIATCVDALNGETLWQQRIEGNYSASPLFADGKLYFTNREGRTTVLKPGREFETLAVNQLDGQWLASPAAIDGALFLRSATHLYRIG